MALLTLQELAPLLFIHLYFQVILIVEAINFIINFK